MQYWNFSLVLCDTIYLWITIIHQFYKWAMSFKCVQETPRKTIPITVSLPFKASYTYFISWTSYILGIPGSDIDRHKALYLLYMITSADRRSLL